MAISTGLHNLAQPNGTSHAYAPITRETRFVDSLASLCDTKRVRAWTATETPVNCPACIEAIDAAHALALVSTLVTVRTQIRPQFLREGDLIEADGCVYRVDDEPCVDDAGVAVIPVDVFGWAHSVEVPTTGWVTLVMQELVPLDLDEDAGLAVAA